MSFRRGHHGGSGTDSLARKFGTEEDKVNCPFYFKIGACRHGDRCSRLHVKPTFSQTVMIAHMYTLPGEDMDARDAKEHFYDFYEEVFEEVQKFGHVEDMHVCENLGDHLVGNVYIRYSDEDEAEAAVRGLQGRFYEGRPLMVELSPVSDFREARCRQFDEEGCSRGGYCNFMHLKRVPRDLKKHLMRNQPNEPAASSNRDRSRSRSRSRSPRRERRSSRRSSRSRSPDGRSSRRRRSSPRSRSGPRSPRPLSPGHYGGSASPPRRRPHPDFHPELDDLVAHHRSEGHNGRRVSPPPRYDDLPPPPPPPPHSSDYYAPQEAHPPPRRDGPPPPYPEQHHYQPQQRYREPY